MLNPECPYTPGLVESVLCSMMFGCSGRANMDSDYTVDEQSTSSMATTMMEITHGLTYSVARAIEVTIWQSDNAICHCCLTQGSCHWTQISSGYSDGGYRQCMSMKLARVLSSIHAISI